MRLSDAYGIGLRAGALHAVPWLQRLAAAAGTPAARRAADAVAFDAPHQVRRVQIELRDAGLWPEADDLPAPDVLAWSRKLDATVPAQLRGRDPLFEYAWRAGFAAGTGLASVQILEKALGEKESPEVAALIAGALDALLAAAATLRELGGRGPEPARSKAVELTVMAEEALESMEEATGPQRQRELAQIAERIERSAANETTIFPQNEPVHVAPADAHPPERAREMLSKILRHPDDPSYEAARDDTLRREYARQIAASDPPRSRFIQVALELDGGSRRPKKEIDALAAERKRLLDAHGREWARPVASLGVTPGFHRGFVGRVEGSPATLQSTARRVYDLAPVTAFFVHGGSKSELVALVGSPILRRIRVLDLGDAPVDVEVVRALAGSPHAANLIWLGLRNRGLDERAVEALAASKTLQSLQYVNLDGNRKASIERNEGRDEMGGTIDLGPNPLVRRLVDRYGDRPWFEPTLFPYAHDPERLVLKAPAGAQHTK